MVRSGRKLDEFGTPYRIRTGVTAVRGQRPEPLDEGSGVFGPAGQGPLLYGCISKAQDALQIAWMSASAGQRLVLYGRIIRIQAEHH